MNRFASPLNKPAEQPESPGFVPWEGTALDERPTTPYAITDRLPASAPARVRPAPVASPAPALPRPALGVHDWRWPVAVVLGVVLLAALLSVGAALAARTGGKRLLFAATGSPAGAALPPNGTSGLEPSADADHRPMGVPVKRTDWMITKDYEAHGGNDPVARQKWGAVDFAFWHNKDAFGAEIIATHAGTVKLLEDDPTYGNLVYVVGPHYTTTYGHMQKFNVTAGQQVRRGDVIGFMGSTGASTGPHVDYQVWLDGQNQNPMDYCQCAFKGPDVP